MFNTLLVAHEMPYFQVEVGAQEISAQANIVHDSVPAKILLEESALVQETSAGQGNPVITNVDQIIITTTPIYELGITDVADEQQTFKNYEKMKLLSLLRAFNASDDSLESQEARALTYEKVDEIRDEISRLHQWAESYTQLKVQKVKKPWYKRF